MKNKYLGWILKIFYFYKFKNNLLLKWKIEILIWLQNFVIIKSAFILKFYYDLINIFLDLTIIISLSYVHFKFLIQYYLLEKNSDITKIINIYSFQKFFHLLSIKSKQYFIKINFFFIFTLLLYCNLFSQKLNLWESNL
jgi:hypothetical protein